MGTSMRTTNGYDKDFFSSQSQGSHESAKLLLPVLLEILPEIKSAVDIGCGTGAWLSVLWNLGVEQIKGYDGEWVDKDFLKIPKDCFNELDLCEDSFLEEKYDLAISVEVAEHLPEEFARPFIEKITHVSNIVLFSAAVPYQGGTNHVNEQWQSYWFKIFRDFGYMAIDYLRKRIWNEVNIKWWYRQNTILYVKEKDLGLIQVGPDYYIKNHEQIDIICPELYLKKVETR